MIHICVTDASYGRGARPELWPHVVIDNESRSVWQLSTTGWKFHREGLLGMYIYRVIHKSFRFNHHPAISGYGTLKPAATTLWCPQSSSGKRFSGSAILHVHWGSGDGADCDDNNLICDFRLIIAFHHISCYSVLYFESPPVGGNRRRKTANVLAGAREDIVVIKLNI